MPSLAAERSPLRRRLLLAAAGVLALLVAVVLMTDGDGESGEDPVTPSTPAPPATSRVVSSPEAGIRLRVPRGWTATRRTRGVELRSADRTATLAIGSPPGARTSSQLLRSALDVARKRYRDLRVTATDSRQIARLPAISTVVSARNRRGPVRALIGAIQGRRRAWLVEIFVAQGGPAARLAEGQVALGSLSLSD